VRVEGALKCDIMPWILGKAEELVTKHDNMAAYAPKFALHSFLD
jgi:hypothetical protein